MYAKRVLIFNETNGNFAEAGRQLCGMVKLVSVGGKTQATVFVTNADVTRFGEWWIVLTMADKLYVRQLTTLNNFTFDVESDRLERVGALLVKREEKCYVVCEAYLTDVSVNDFARANVADLIGAGARKKEATDLPPTAYEPFVTATEEGIGDAQEAVDVETLRSDAVKKYKSVEEYSSAFERYYLAGRGDNYYKSVQKEITRLFIEFPPYYPLIKKWSHSYFVRIDFPGSDRFFVLGVVQKEGAVRYICYGLPGEKEGFSDKDFVYVEGESGGFWMLYQDAETGQITAA